MRPGGHLRHAFGYAVHVQRAVFDDAGHVQQLALCVLYLGRDVPGRERHVREPAGDSLQSASQCTQTAGSGHCTVGGMACTLNTDCPSQNGTCVTPVGYGMHGQHRLPTHPGHMQHQRPGL